MKILVVDDEPSFAALLARALRRMGHVVATAGTPIEAIGLARGDGYEAVITSLELPEMDGFEMAAVLRAQHEDMAIAFCTSASDDIRERAARIGPVLPRVWTVATLKEVVIVLEREVKLALAAGTGRSRPEPLRNAPTASGRWASRGGAGNPLGVAPAMRPQSERSDAPLDLLAEGPILAPEAGPKNGRPPVRKIRLSCRSWEQVERLCEQHAAGKTVLTLRGNYRLRMHEELVVALALPDELVLSLRAEVIAIRPAETGGSVFAVGLTGLTDAVVQRLENMIVSARSGGGTRPRIALRAQSEISIA